MTRFSFFSVLKFLPGILLVQAATGILVVVALKTPLEDTWILFVLLALTTALLVALWFASVADHVKNKAVAQAKHGFVREREKLRVNAEKEKSKVIKQSHQQAAKATNRAQSKANFKTGVALAGVMGLGAIMVFSQLFTLGLITLSTAGGALLGYGVRARQGRWLGKAETAPRLGAGDGVADFMRARPVLPAIKGPVRSPKKTGTSPA